jgi:hypothetical protein
MRDARFSTRPRPGCQSPARRSARGRLILAAGAAVVLIAAPVTVSPYALALGWQLAAAKSARGSHGNARGHGNGDHRNGGAHAHALGHRDARGHGGAHDADRSHGRLHDNRGWHNGRDWHNARDWTHGGNVQDQGGNVQDQGGSVPVDDEAPPS